MMLFFFSKRVALLTVAMTQVATVTAADKFRVNLLWPVYEIEDAGQISSPEGVASRNGRVVVADSGNNRLLLFKNENGRMSDGQVAKTPAMKYPKRVHLTSTDDILVQDGRTHQILRFNSDGKIQSLLKPTGLPDKHPVWIGSFALANDDRILLLDVAGNRVLMLSAEGAYQDQIPLPETGGVFSDLTIDAKGTVYILDSVKGRVHAAPKGIRTFSPLTESLTKVAHFPTHITVDSDGFLYLTDHNGGGVVRLDRNGHFKGRALSLGWNPGQLYYPAQIAFSEGGEMIVADRSNSRIQIFRQSSD